MQGHSWLGHNTQAATLTLRDRAAEDLQESTEKCVELVACRDGGGAPGRRLGNAMGDHAAMQRADGFAAPRQAEPGKQTVHEAGKGASQHAGAEAESRSHVLEVGLVDRGRVIGESPKHLAILESGAENGLLVSRPARHI